jgi:hypothetical protein
MIKIVKRLHKNYCSFFKILVGHAVVSFTLSVHNSIEKCQQNTNRSHAKAMQNKGRDQGIFSI